MPFSSFLRTALTIFLVLGALVSGALGQASETGEGEGFEITARSTGFIPFSKNGLKSILMEAGFQMVREESSEDEKTYVLAAMAAKQPFLFILEGCEKDACIFLNYIHPIDIAYTGLAIKAAEAAELTNLLPFGYFVAEPDGSITLRHGMPMAKQCADACLISQIGMFMANASAVHIALLELMEVSRNSASLDNQQEQIRASIDKTFHYETLRVESGIRAAKLTGMKDFLGTLAMRAKFSPASVPVVDVNNPHRGLVPHWTGSGAFTANGPITGQTIDLVEFKALFPKKGGSRPQD